MKLPTNWEWGRCNNCGESGWVSSHECPPVFYWALEPDEWEPSRKVHAINPEEAAKKAASRWFWLDPSTGMEELTVYVRGDNEQTATQFKVTIEMAPVFTAEEVGKVPLPPDTDDDPEVEEAEGPDEFTMVEQDYQNQIGGPT
jgi:hypothetical protein